MSKCSKCDDTGLADAVGGFIVNCRCEVGRKRILQYQISDLTSERDKLRGDSGLRGAQLLAVASELAGDPKLDHADRSDPRWTPTLQEAWAARQKHKEDSAQIVSLIHERDAALARVKEIETECNMVIDETILACNDANARADASEARERKLVGAAKKATEYDGPDTHQDGCCKVDMKGTCCCGMDGLRDAISGSEAANPKKEEG